MERIKKFKLKPEKIKNAIIFAIFLIFFILIFINDFGIQFSYNNFGSVSSSELQVYFLDVGQASSALIILPNKFSIVVDTGSKESEKDFLKSVDYLLHKNKINSIEYLFLTHSDEDHIGGTSGLLKKYQVYNIFRPKLLSSDETGEFKKVDTKIYDETISQVSSEPNCNVEFIENETMQVEGLTIRIFAPEKELYEEVNSYSPFILLEFMNYSFMFTGDATNEREQEFVAEVEKSGFDAHVDFLSVAHHGSSSSTTIEFLETVTPTFAFINAGDKTHPTNTVLNRLQKIGVQGIFVTKYDGMIGVGIKNGEFFTRTLSDRLDTPAIVTAFALVTFNLMSYPVDFYRRKKDIFVDYKKILK